MPLFEYRCEDCGTRFEKLVRRSEEAASLVCPSCGQNHLETELSTFAAHAGSGTASQASMPSCPGGMCRTPGLCGRN